MIDFGNFYSLIAKNHLSHWLETLPAQIANWQREQQHGLFKQWSNADGRKRRTTERRAN